LIAGFFARLVVLYVALMVLWPALKAPYRAGYRAFGNICFSRIGSGATARFEPWPIEEEIKDGQVVLENYTVPGAKIKILMPISTRYAGYMPTAVVISLILATPLPWRRRWVALAFGLVLVHLFILLWLGVSILDDLSDPIAGLPTHGYILAPAIKSVLKFLVENVVESVIACAYIAPIFIWIAAAFRRRDREWLFQRIVPAQSESSNRPA